MSNERAVIEVEQSSAVLPVAEVGARQDADGSSATVLTLGQSGQKNALMRAITARASKFFETRGSESRAFHGPMVRDVAGMYALMFRKEGAKEVSSALKEAFDAGTPTVEEPSRRIVQFSSRKRLVVEAANPGSRQYRKRWTDMGRWEASLVNDPSLVPDILTDDEVAWSAEKNRNHGYAVALESGVRINGKLYRGPADALDDGQPMLDVYNGFKNIINPSKTDLTTLPLLKQAVEAATIQAIEQHKGAKGAGHPVVVKVLETSKANKTERIRRKQIGVLSDPALTTATIAGLVAGAKALGFLDRIEQDILDAVANPPSNIPGMEKRLQALAEAAATDEDEHEDEATEN